MDAELLIALLVLWISSTCALVAFLSMWLFNEGESFHPHSVDVDHRHSLYVVVHGDTCCKLDCCVKSISAFVAPRGSSSSKQFTVICVMISVSGFLGTYRWYRVGDGEFLEVCLALIGFASLILVAFFELDVIPDRFLEDKLIVTSWLIQKLHMENYLDFDINNCRNESLLTFIRQSPLIYHLYEEDLYLRQRIKTRYQKFTIKGDIWSSLHIFGAIFFVIFVTAAILINDSNEEKVAWITGICFLLFSMMGYLTGNYFYVLPVFRGWIIIWNPFLRDPHFMTHLCQSIIAYHNRKRITETSYKENLKNTCHMKKDLNVTSSPVSDISHTTTGSSSSSSSSSDGSQSDQSVTSSKDLDVYESNIAYNMEDEVLSPPQSNLMNRYKNTSDISGLRKRRHQNSKKSYKKSSKMMKTSENNTMKLQNFQFCNKFIIQKPTCISSDMSNTCNKNINKLHTSSSYKSFVVIWSSMMKYINHINIFDTVIYKIWCYSIFSSCWEVFKTQFLSRWKNSLLSYSLKSTPNNRKDLYSLLPPHINIDHNGLLYMNTNISPETLDSYTLNNPFLKWARSNPKSYLKIIGHILVMSELISMLTPVVAMGLQWITALCDESPMIAIIDLCTMIYECLLKECRPYNHCIVKHY